MLVQMLLLLVALAALLVLLAALLPHLLARVVLVQAVVSAPVEVVYWRGIRRRMLLLRLRRSATLHGRRREGSGRETTGPDHACC
jgi:hypothetical protein